MKDIKVVLLGESGVGKSSILMRFCLDEFNMKGSATLGAAFMSKTIEIEDQSTKFQIWDTAGQEKYKAILPLYYRDAHVAIIVYDITNLQSFLTLKEWIHQIKLNGPKHLIKVIVGNKLDLSELSQVQTNIAEEFAEQNYAKFLLTSCKDNEGVKELFEIIAKEYMEWRQTESLKEQEKEKASLTLKLQQKPSPQKQQQRKCCL